MYQSQWQFAQRDIVAIAERVKATHPKAWAEVKIPGQKSRAFIDLVAQECRAAGIPAGMNLKRGGPEISIDVLALPNETGCPDSTGTYPGLELRDIIGGAEGPNAVIIYGDATPATIDAGVSGGYTETVESAPPVQPPAPSFPYPDEQTTIKAYQAKVKATYNEAGRQFPDPNDSDAFRWFSRYGYSCDKMPEPVASAKHLAELRAELGLPA